MELTVIDVSKHQGAIDWNKVKSSGIDIAILRCGFGDDYKSQDDSTFETNYRKAREAGIAVGVYLYSYATNVSHAKSEAAHMARLVADKKIDFGYWYDLEDMPTTGKCSKSVIGDIAETFAREMHERLGVKVGIYASKYWFTSILTDNRFNQWDKWVAQYNSECTYSGKHVGWQYSSMGSVPGINGRVDLSEFYVDYRKAEASDVKPAESNKPDLSGYTGTSIVGALNAKGYRSDYGYREQIAHELGISDYRGTAEQNLKLITMLGGVVEKASESQYIEYTVQKGDTLTSIAKKYGTTWRTLQQINHIADANKIYPGQKIRVV